MTRLWRQRLWLWIYDRRHRAYSVRLTLDVFDGGFVAQVKERPGCLAQGDTAPEALRELANALEAVLDLDPEPSS